MIGFARTIAGLTEFTLIALVTIGAFWGLFRTFIFPREEDDDDSRHVLNIVAIILAALFILNFVISAVLLSTANRTPRQDLDRSEIYQQMESNKTGNK
jgi:succinate-acetate transporter protein